MVRSLFNLVVPIEQASRQFRDFSEGLVFQAARRLMDETFAEFRDVDKSFIREFQTAGFSPRVFELALFAYLREQGYSLDREHPAPDYLITGERPVAIEACTTNPAQGATSDDPGLPADWRPYVPKDVPDADREFVFQVAKALRRKLVKRDAHNRAYWEMPHVRGVPFVIAVHAFHRDSAYFSPGGILSEYLYGRRDQASFTPEGELVLVAEQVDDHRHGGKQIPSGLFQLPEASDLSAVLFSNSSTVNVFNRIGTQMGYGPPNVAMIRIGTVYDPDPNAIEPQPFGQLIEPADPDARETFGEGFHLYHNPWARVPLADRDLRGVTDHHLLEDGLLLTMTDHLSPFVSQTRIYEGERAEAHAREQLASYLNFYADEAANTQRRK